jgi:uncharacterized protein YcgI (DUF1989 family)
MSASLRASAEGEIPQGRATLVDVSQGQRVRVVNHLGQQVVDTWVFLRGKADEFLSMEHCRGKLYKLFFEPGDVLISNLRRPLVEITADTSPGRHDTLCSACDAGSYAEYGQGPNHADCRAHILAGFAERGLTLDMVPCPWNLFMDIPVAPDGSLSDRPSSAQPGDYVELKALADITLVCSPCPQAAIPISGIGCPPRSVRWARFDAERTSGDNNSVV